MPKKIYEIRPATLEDAKELAYNLREADLDEIQASTDLSPEEAILISMKASPDARAGFVDGELMCIFGVARASLLSTRGCPWMLGTDLLVKNSRRFIRVSKFIVKRWTEDYVYLCNFVDMRNEYSLKWIKWLGFDISPAQPYGPYDMMFHKFEIKSGELNGEI